MNKKLRDRTLNDLGAILMVVFILVFIVVVFLASVAQNAAQEKCIVLTFDDGPKPYVLYGLDITSQKPTGQPGLLKVLEYAKVPAHFFVIGFKAETQKNIVRELSAKGFLFENHTYGHGILQYIQKKRGVEGIKADLLSVDKLLTTLTGRKPEYFRPRSWLITTEEERFIRKELGYIILKLGNPDLNMTDYDFHEKKRPAAELANYVKSRIASRERASIFRHVLAFHELPITTEALVELIPYFSGRGYRFTTLDKCMTPSKEGVAG